MNRIKQLRREKGLSQKELGTLLNINVPTVSKYESEDVDISASKLRILSELFNTSIDYILCNDKKIAFISNNEDNNLSKREKKMLNEFRVLPEERKIKIEARIEAEYDIVMEAKQTRSKDA